MGVALEGLINFPQRPSRNDLLLSVIQKLYHNRIGPHDGQDNALPALHGGPFRIVAPMEGVGGHSLIFVVQSPPALV